MPQCVIALPHGHIPGNSGEKKGRRPGGAPATLPAVQIQNLAPGFNYNLATISGKLTLTASNNATAISTMPIRFETPWTLKTR